MIGLLEITVIGALMFVMVVSLAWANHRGQANYAMRSVESRKHPGGDRIRERQDRVTG